MEVKITGGESVYKNVMDSVRKGQNPAHTSGSSDIKAGPKRHTDEIIISGDGMRKQEAAKAAQSLYEKMGQDQKAERIARLKQQVGNGTYQVSSEEIAERLLLLKGGIPEEM